MQKKIDCNLIFKITSNTTNTELLRNDFDTEDMRYDCFHFNIIKFFYNNINVYHLRSFKAIWYHQLCYY